MEHLEIPPEPNLNPIEKKANKIREQLVSYEW